MKTLTSLLSLFCLLTCGMLYGQTSSVDTVLAAETDFSRRSLVNRDALNRTLRDPDNNYFIAPPPVEYSVDPKKLYYQAGYRNSVIEFIGDETLEVPARYQLLNQKFEVVIDRKVFDLDNDKLMSLTMGDDSFIFLYDPLRRIAGRVIHQVHFKGDNHQLLEQHQVEWQKPQLDSPYGKIENKQSLNRFNNLILQVGTKFYPINSSKDMIKALDLPKKGTAQRYIKSEKLKLNKPADAKKLLEFIAAR